MTPVMNPKRTVHQPVPQFFKDMTRNLLRNSPLENLLGAFRAVRHHHITAALPYYTGGYKLKGCRSFEGADLGMFLRQNLKILC